MYEAVLYHNCLNNIHMCKMWAISHMSNLMQMHIWPEQNSWSHTYQMKSPWLSQYQPNFAEMILSWSPFKIVSVSAVLYPRWPPLLKIEISSNGQNCSILSQKVPKFELYKHNEELFNVYYGIFYELWNLADFDRLCKLEKKGGWN